MKRLLIVDDEKRVRDGLRLALTGEPITLIEAESPARAYELMQSEQPDLVLLDVHFPDGVTCHQLLQRLQSEDNVIPIIVLSGAASAKEAADAMRLGAYDFLEKPLTSERLRVSVTNALEATALRAAFLQITTLRNIRTQLLGTSDAIRDVQKLIALYANKDVRVLITGETGTGKEIVADAIWQGSERRKQPFIVINAAAIPENLVESELFGHRKGSFTGATNNQIGKIEMADHGTLFLDEIGELSLQAQAKLLRFLETGEIQVLGSNVLRRCDVRLIAATSRDLVSEMRAGRFREDLYFRLNVARIELPPLRQRGKDALLLFEFFLKNYSVRYDVPRKSVAEEADTALLNYKWPGNVRELRNVAERAALQPAAVISGAVIRQMTGSDRADAKPDKATGLPQTLAEVKPLKDFRRALEAAYIEQVLSLAGGNVTNAAKALGVDRSHLHQKIRELGP